MNLLDSDKRTPNLRIDANQCYPFIPTDSGLICTRSILSANKFHSFCNLLVRRSEDILLSTFRWGIRRGDGDITALHRSRIRAYFFDPKTLRFISVTELQLSRRRYQDVKLNRFKKSLAGFFSLSGISQFWLWCLWSSPRREEARILRASARNTGFFNHYSPSTCALQHTDTISIDIINVTRVLSKLTWIVIRTLWQGSLKILCNVNRMFIQSYMVFIMF